MLRIFARRCEPQRKRSTDQYTSEAENTPSIRWVWDSVQAKHTDCFHSTADGKRANASGPAMAGPLVLLAGYSESIADSGLNLSRIAQAVANRPVKVEQQRRG